MLTRCLEIRKSAGEGADSPYAAQIAATLCNIGHVTPPPPPLPASPHPFTHFGSCNAVTSGANATPLAASGGGTG